MSDMAAHPTVDLRESGLVYARSFPLIDTERSTAWRSGNPIPWCSRCYSASAGEHAGHSPGAQSLPSASLAVGVHTAGYVVVTALVAAIIYENVGLAVLRTAWVNMDLIWAGALVLTGLLLS